MTYLLRNPLSRLRRGHSLLRRIGGHGRGLSKLKRLLLRKHRRRRATNLCVNNSDTCHSHFCRPCHQFPTKVNTSPALKYFDRRKSHNRLPSPEVPAAGTDREPERDQELAPAGAERHQVFPGCIVRVQLPLHYLMLQGEPLLPAFRCSSALHRPCLPPSSTTACRPKGKKHNIYTLSFMINRWGIVLRN